MLSKKSAVLSILVLVSAYLYYKNNNNKEHKSALVRDGKTIEIPLGRVQGSVSLSRDGREFYSWFRIPFTKPPLGTLRFADPLDPENWEGVIDGRKIGPQCAQANAFGMGEGDALGEEDCLHLNVFVPKQLHDQLGSESKNTLVPVIVYIHGGGYIGGSSLLFGPEYLMDRDVVVVSINYRLDALGFLTTGDKVVRGNMGLKDQLMALKWVNKYIYYFGGDSKQVTIFGTSGGAGSVHHHMLSPMTKGLFHQVFAQSGSAFSAWSLISPQKSLQKTKDFAEHLNCPSGSSEEMVECLRRLDVKELLSARAKALKDKFYAAYPDQLEEGFVPTIEAVKHESAFISENPMKVLAEGRGHRVPLLIGHTSHEGLMTSARFIKDPEAIQKFESNLAPSLKTFFRIENENSDELARKIHKLYIPQGVDVTLEEKTAAYTDLMGDAHFNFDIRQTVLVQRKYSPTYYYIHNKTDVPDPMGIALYITGKRPVLLDLGYYFLRTFVRQRLFGLEPNEYGIGHAADAFYYLPMMSDYIAKGSERYEYSKDLVNLLIEFASGHELEFRGQKITPCPPEGPLEIVEFKNDGVEVGPEPFEERMEFLASLNIRNYS